MYRQSGLFLSISTPSAVDDSAGAAVRFSRQNEMTLSDGHVDWIPGSDGLQQGPLRPFNMGKK